jgi:hypothetical protein
MTISDEQVAQMAEALREEGFSENELQALHQTIDRIYSDIRMMCEACMQRGVPAPVRQPLFETTKDIGGLRDAFALARLART